MRLLYVTDAFAVWGGMERVLTDKMNYLSECYGYDVVLLTINQGHHSIPFPLHSRIKQIDLDVRMHQQYDYCGVSRLLKRCQLEHLLFDKLKDVLFQVKSDIIVCVKLDFVGILNKVKGDVPLIVESHTLCNAELYEKSGIYRKIHFWILKRYIRKVDALVALTEGDASDWRKTKVNVYVIPNVVNLNDKATYSMCQAKSVIFVGRISRQKNIGILLNIWEKVYLHHSDWRLHIYGEIGDVESDVYERLLSSCKYGVCVHKPIKENMIEEYKKHSILLLTSLFEPFGLVIPEAMSCGLPIVSFDSPYGPSSIITNGYDGFIVDNNDENSFCSKLFLLMEDDNMRRRMGSNAINSSKRYTDDTIMPLWVKLFERIIEQKKNPRLK